MHTHVRAHAQGGFYIGHVDVARPRLLVARCAPRSENHLAAQNKQPEPMVQLRHGVLVHMTVKVHLSRPTLLSPFRPVAPCAWCKLTYMGQLAGQPACAPEGRGRWVAVCSRSMSSP